MPSDVFLIFNFTLSFLTLIFKF